jgi:hypothetical protein
MRQQYKLHSSLNFNMSLSMR